MAKNSVSDWDTTAANNLDIAAISIAEGCPPGNINDAFRAGMAQIASYTRKGADIASAATLNLDAVDTMGSSITGTTTVTAITLSNGHFRRCKAAGAFLLTASATLVVNGSTTINYSTRDGDLLMIEGGASAVTVNVISQAPATVFLSEAIISAAATSDIALPTGYDGFVFELVNIKPATDGADLWMRLSLSGSVSTSGYQYASSRVNTSATSADAGSASAAAVILAPGVGSAASVGQIKIEIIPSANGQIDWKGNYVPSSGSFLSISGAGRLAAVTPDSVRFMFSTGDITSGTIRLYGLRR